MTEITRENSPEVMETCLRRFLHCSFLSLDLKYNVPVPAAASQPTPDPAAQYAALRSHILENKMSAMYAGLVAYYDSPNSKRYTAYSYSAQVRHLGAYRKTESFDGATLAALSADHFDLNRYFGHAIPYLNRREEERLREELQKYATVMPMKRAATFGEESFVGRHMRNKKIRKLVTERCHEVRDWLVRARSGESLVLEGTDYRDTMGFYILRKELLGLFPTVWASTRGFKMCINNVLCTLRRKYETNECMTMKPEGFVVDALTTFRRLVRRILTLDVPVVGHDLLLALMVLYNQVEEELPETYESFVSSLGMRGRPTDTRRLAATMAAKRRPAGDKPDSTDLEPMYRYLRNGAGLSLTCASRFVVAATPERPVEVGPAFAGGGDAFKAGYLYVKLDYFLSEWGIEVFPLFLSTPADPTGQKTAGSL